MTTRAEHSVGDHSLYNSFVLSIQLDSNTLYQDRSVCIMPSGPYRQFAAHDLRAHKLPLVRTTDRYLVLLQELHAHAVLQELHAHAVLQELNVYAVLQELHAHAVLQELHAHAMLQELHAHAVLQELHAHAVLQELHAYAVLQELHEKAARRRITGSHNRTGSDRGVLLMS